MSEETVLVPCPHCGVYIKERLRFCPHCGAQLNAPHVPDAAPAPRARWSIPWPDMPDAAWLFVALFLAGWVVAVLIGFSLAGVWQGLQERNREAAEWMLKAEVYEQEGNLDFAIAALQEALRLDPSNEAARRKLAELQARQIEQPTPIVVTREQAARMMFDEGKAFYDQDKWEQAIAKWEGVRELKTGYRDADLKALLFTAYVRAAQAKVDEEAWEEAIVRFDKALALKPDDPDVKREREYADLYQKGLSFSGPDWIKAAEAFGALYRKKKDYKQVANRYAEALYRWGDIEAKAGHPCTARDLYAQSLSVVYSGSVAAKRDEAAARCP